MDFDYKKYSLENLENWLHDAISSGEAEPQEIYDVIKGVIQEEYYYYKNGASKTYELLALLNGNGVGHISAYDDYLRVSEDTTHNYPDENGIYFCSGDDPAPYCKGSWNDFWEEHYYPEEHKKDKVTKWVLPVEETKDADTDETEYFVSFPDDLLEAANLKKGDQVEWVDQGDGSYLLRKV